MPHLKPLLVSLLISCLISCKSKTNQLVHNKPEGKWITFDTLASIYKTKGYYHNGNEIGTWKQYCNGKLYKKEKYRQGFTQVKFYHPNGKIMKKGITRLEATEKENHWYYDGDWRFYNTKGKLVSIKRYQKEDYTDK